MRKIRKASVAQRDSGRATLVYLTVSAHLRNSKCAKITYGPNEGYRLVNGAFLCAYPSSHCVAVSPLRCCFISVGRREKRTHKAQ